MYSLPSSRPHGHPYCESRRLLQLILKLLIGMCAKRVGGLSMPKVSVIVPVYNVEKYLKQCLDSILEQTLEEIEIVCVDDGSTDSSGEILDQYATKDERVRVIHRKNAGYGSAMNVGLEIATGEYIGIVESDDCILPDMYKTLYEEAVSDSLDLVKSDAYYWLEKAQYKKRIHYKHLESFYDRVLSDIERNVFFDFVMNIWTGIYKREFLTKYQIRFHESPGASYQDNGFWIQTLSYCKSAKWLNQAFYLYRQDNETSSVKSRDKMFAMTKEYEYIEKLLRDRGDEEFLPYCYYYKLFRHRGTFFRIADENKREFCDEIKKDYARYKCYIKGFAAMDGWLRKASTQPEELCENVIQKKKSIKKCLDHASHIIIYGAGTHGDIIFRGLYNEGYYDKISCFAVSQNPPEYLFAGKQIVKIETALESYKDALVVIAVARGSNIYRHMVEKLAQLGINDFLDGSLIEESFYIL